MNHNIHEKQKRQITDRSALFWQNVASWTDRSRQVKENVTQVDFLSNVSTVSLWTVFLEANTIPGPIGEF